MRQSTKNTIPTKDELLKLYNIDGLSTEKIARMFGWSQTGIGKLMERLDIPRRKAPDACRQFFKTKYVLNGKKDDNRTENLVAMPRNKHHSHLVYQVQQERIRELEQTVSFLRSRLEAPLEC